MKSLKVLKERYTLSEAIDRAIDFKPPVVHSDHGLFSAFADSAKRFAEISTGLRSICRNQLDFDFEPPLVEGFGAAAAALSFEETLDAMRVRLHEAIGALAAALDVQQMGRIEWLDQESCRFTFFEVCRDRGVLHNTVRRVAHTHDLVKARIHRLPAIDVPKPRQAEEILRMIPDSLRPYVRIVTGLEVLKDVREQSRRDELTWLGQALNDGKRHTQEAAQSVAAATRSAATKVHEVVTSERFRQNAQRAAAGAGLAALGGAALAGLVAAASSIGSMMALAVADPAVVIGELCLYGWED